MANVLYERNALRIPVSRICDDLQTMGLKMTPQRLYENLYYYGGFFQILQDQMWTILLNTDYIQIDETPVRYYDRQAHQMKRGYIWVFTTSEMPEFKKYEESERKNEEILTSVIECF